MISRILKLIFGNKSERDIKRMKPLVENINRLELSYQQLSEEQLKAKTDEFKKRLAAGETTDDILCEAYAVVKNACRRLCGTKTIVCDHELIWNMIPFDVQLMGAIALHRGGIAEMATGEGKTLVATMPLYLNALTGRNCQLVTVNDYLARRDSEWMGTLYTYLGLSVGCLQNQQPPPFRKEQYGKDITYGTNSEFGFDYLRDMGMAMHRDHLVQRDHFFAIIDEVDSILIDEARTPLIISGPVAQSSHQFDSLNPLIADLYNRQNLLCSRLIQEAKNTLSNPDASKDDHEDAILKLLKVKLGLPKHKQLMHVLEDGEIFKEVERTELFVKSDQNRGMLQEVQADLFFSVDEKQHEADLTEKGRNTISPADHDAFILPDLLSTLHDIENDNSIPAEERLKKKQEFQQYYAKKSEAIQNISQLLKAYCLFEKDVSYVVQDNKVMIVDEHTGRLMPGRRFSDGLHQALEAKENVAIEKETQTLATITIQNYFRLYKKLAGMTGTAETEANEFHQIYKLDVIVVPTNKPCLRKDTNDSIYKTKRETFNAILNEVEDCFKRGQPVLIGTISVEDSEILSRMLRRKQIPHNVLNAKNHQLESEIVARAGQRGAVTVATNMAGRGTDIKLGEGVAALGGLHVIGSSRHDSRRIDRQLRGRCSRQGDPGSSRFYVSLEDTLMRLFGSDRIVKIMERLGLEEGEELQHPWLNKSIETAQKRVEQHHFSIRKRTLEYDDVMNKQREVIYGFRKQVLFDDNTKDIIMSIVEKEIDRKIDESLELKEGNASSGALDKDSLLAWLNLTFPIGFTMKDIDDVAIDASDASLDKLHEMIFSKIKTAYTLKESFENPESLHWLERHIVLDAVDRLWQDHLYAMDHLRSSIGFRAYAQKDPLVEYKHEAFRMFDELMKDINQEILMNMFRSATSLAAFEQLFASLPQQLIHQSIDQLSSVEETIQQTQPEPEPEPVAQQESQESQEVSADDIQITFKRNLPKVGRNDLCPCGSGKKFKKCCGS